LPTRLTRRGVQGIRARAGRWVISGPTSWGGGILSGLLNVLIPQDAASDDVIDRRYRIGEDEFDVRYPLVRR
jgi:hypothetical protein